MFAALNTKRKAVVDALKKPSVEQKPMTEQPAQTGMMPPTQAGPKYSPELIRALAGNATISGPVQHPLEAVARIVSAMSAGHMSNVNQREDKAYKDKQRQYLVSTLAGRTDVPEPVRQMAGAGLVEPGDLLPFLTPKTPQAPREQTVTVAGGDFGNMKVRQQDIGGRWVDQSIEDREPEKAPAAPSGYQWNQDRSALMPIPGGPADKQGATGLDQKDINTQTNAVADDFTRQSGPFVDMRDAYRRIEQAIQSPSPAGDMAVVYNYMKLLDPGSVVREAEFETAAKAGSFGEQVRAAVERASSGKLLTDEMRADFVKQAQGMMQSQLQSHNQLELQYSDRSAREGLDPRSTVIDYVSGLLDQLKAQQGGRPQFTPPMPVQKPSPSSSGAPITQEEYDALPIGATYTGMDGKQYMKKP